MPTRSTLKSTHKRSVADCDLEFKFNSHKIAIQGIANTAIGSKSASASASSSASSTVTDKSDTMAKGKKRSRSKRSINTSVRRMDQAATTTSIATATASSSSKKEAAFRADQLLEESKAIRRFAKILGALCVLLVFMVFGVDLALLEDIAALVVHNVVAAVILVGGLHVANHIYESIATPVPGSPQDSSPRTPLQGLVRRPSHGGAIPLQRRSKRPDSIIVPVPQKRNSGGLFSGLWPRRKKRSSKNKNHQELQQQQQQQQQLLLPIPSKSRKRSKKVSLGRRRGWPSSRLSATGSI